MNVKGISIKFDFYNRDIFMMKLVDYVSYMNYDIIARYTRVFLNIVNFYLLDRFCCWWWNWNDVCVGWIIYSYVTIFVEMKPEYWGLKGNQATMVTYASIYLSITELI